MEIENENDDIEQESKSDDDSTITTLPFFVLVPLLVNFFTADSTSSTYSSSGASSLDSSLPSSSLSLSDCSDDPSPQTLINGSPNGTPGVEVGGIAFFVASIGKRCFVTSRCFLNCSISEHNTTYDVIRKQRRYCTHECYECQCYNVGFISSDRRIAAKL